MRALTKMCATHVRRNSYSVSDDLGQFHLPVTVLRAVLLEAASLRPSPPPIW
jgi:hypothetical protein